MLKNKIKNPRHKDRRVRQAFWRKNLKIFTFGLSVFCILVFGFWIYSFAREQFIYDDKGKRNPFIPLVTSSGRILNLDKDSDSGLHVEGIIYDKRGVSYAIVNQDVVKIGDWVGDYRVFKIDKERVIFLKGGEPLEIKFNKEGL